MNAIEPPARFSPVTTDLLRSAGEALYGRGWQTPLAETLGVSKRTVRRWLSAESAMPPSLGRELLAACKLQSCHLEQVLAELQQAEARRLDVAKSAR